MAGEGSGADAEMDALIRRLRLHRPGPSPYEPSDAVAPAPAAGELFRPRRAAVLVCLFRGAAGELRVILTKRSSTLSTHSGEVSLPGGKAEEGDADDAATALRESKEEIGLDPALVTVVASLEHFLSKHLLVVVPVIGILSDIQAFIPVLNVAEVDEIFDVPLEMFLKDENRTSEEREKMGQAFTVHYFTYIKGNQKFLVWGLTARILRLFATVPWKRSWTATLAVFLLLSDCSDTRETVRYSPGRSHLPPNLGAPRRPPTPRGGGSSRCPLRRLLVLAASPAAAASPPPSPMPPRGAAVAPLLVAPFPAVPSSFAPLRRRRLRWTPSAPPGSQEPNSRLLAKNRRHLCHDKQQGQPPQLPSLPLPAATHHDHHQQRRPIQPPARTTAISPLESIGSTHCKDG